MCSSTEVTSNEDIVTEEKSAVFSRLEKVYALIVTLLAFGYVEFQIFNPAGFFTTAVNVLIITFSILFLKKHGCKFTVHNIVMAVVMYLFSGVFSITDSGLIKFLNAVFLFFFGAYFLYSAGEGRKNIERYLPFAMIKAVFEFPFSCFGVQALAAKEAIGNSKSAGNLKYIFIGLLMALPVTIVVAVLLISADEGMENIFTEICGSVFSARIFKYCGHFLISIPCGLYLYGMIYANGKRRNLNILDEDMCIDTINSAKLIPNIVLYTAITPVLILYILFFVSQANYFLSAFSGNLPDGYSYAEYARRGFFELCGVTVINLFIIIFMSLLAKNGGRFKTGMMKFYTTLLSSFTLILIAVAISKMVMYISEYGLTRLRLYTTWFMVLCALIFLLIIIKQFKFGMNFACWSLAIFTFMFALLCFGRPDYVVARYNIEMYNAGYLDELDENQICSMSDDAVLYALNEGVIEADDAHYSAHISSEDFIDRSNIPSLLLYKFFRN